MVDNDELVTLIIPQFLQNSLRCFTRDPHGDISKQYKINLRTPEDEPLYITNESDLRDMLKQYCLYKQLCAKVDEEMKTMDLKFQIDDKNVKLVKTAENKTGEISRTMPYKTHTPLPSLPAECDPHCTLGNIKQTTYAPTPARPTPERPKPVVTISVPDVVVDENEKGETPAMDEKIKPAAPDFGPRDDAAGRADPPRANATNPPPKKKCCTIL